MNIKLLIIIILIAIIGGGIFLVSQNSKPSPKIGEDIPKQEEIQGGTSAQALSEQRYIVYSKKTLEQAANKKRVLYFYANWCPVCRPIDAEFKEKMSQIPQNVVVIRVNYNDSDTDAEEKDLAKQYGITYQHTFVQIDSQGNKIALWNGGGLAELSTNIK